MPAGLWSQDFPAHQSPGYPLALFQYIPKIMFILYKYVSITRSDDNNKLLEMLLKLKDKINLFLCYIVLFKHLENIYKYNLCSQ